MPRSLCCNSYLKLEKLYYLELRTAVSSVVLENGFPVFLKILQLGVRKQKPSNVTFCVKEDPDAALKAHFYKKKVQTQAQDSTGRGLDLGKNDMRHYEPAKT